ncbi:MAG TPA: RIP metalloprotease [Kofleriaceae bacterium]|nr:RIP metalloprotease [Kofleriaceae bacterium]
MGQVVGAIFALGFLIMVHEAGHLIVARWCGMKVERFSIGFGPGIIRWRSKKDTIYQIAPIPFGGFVEIRGMNLAEDVDPEDPLAYPNRPVWQRMATIFAGPFTNVLAAVGLAYVLYACHGYDRHIDYFAIADVSKDGASVGKLEVDDRILAVDGVPVYLDGPRGQKDSLRTHFGDRPASLTVLRKRCSLDAPAPGPGPRLVPVHCTQELLPPIVIHPRRDADCAGGPCYRIGVSLINDRQSLGSEPVGPLEAVREAVLYPWRQSKQILGGLWQVVTRKAELEAAGPAGITVVIKQAIESGWVATFLLLMMLNVYLGLFNLFPLPPLDGARLAFLGYELVTRRRANPKIEATVFMIGVLILIPILIMVTVGDCRRMF